jgi:hypothetical protein
MNYKMSTTALSTFRTGYCYNELLRQSKEIINANLCLPIMAYAGETLSSRPSLTLPVSSTFFTLLVLFAQIIQPGQTFALQHLAVVVAGELDHHRGAVGESQLGVQAHKLEQLDSHERKLHAAVH